ncbi:MAG: GRRM system radical SAM/SPASM domain protein [Acidobacteria bacterium]|nr:MAG: GRRM system radical SAM/SPASM domain protein [Acidobacteriota bacterium]
MLDLLVIQPTPFCNLDCAYCYLPFRQSRRRISGDILRQTFQRAFEFSGCGDRFTTVWHSGEPMVMPVAFYREAMEIVARSNLRGVHVGHSLQTNGTMISDEWCSFIRANNFRIGVSIDGPDFLNDRNRKSRGGRGTHSRVITGIQRLHEHGIPFHVITVLTRESLDYPDELFEFYFAHKIREIGFNVEEIEGASTKSSLNSPDVGERFVEFLERFYDLVESASERFVVREFSSALAAIMAESNQEKLFAQQTTPMAIISVDCNGNFGTWSPELLGLKSAVYGDFALGNVMSDSFDSVCRTLKFQTMSNDIASGVQSCRETCEYFPFCGGGAPVNKYFENGTFRSTETMFCRLTKKAVFDVVLRKLEAKIQTDAEASVGAF